MNAAYWMCALIFSTSSSTECFKTGGNPADEPPPKNTLHVIDVGNQGLGKPFSPIDFHNAEQLKSESPPSDFADPIELAELFEGDIVMTSVKCENATCTQDDGSDGKNAIILERQKWTGGMIPYFISAQFSTLERSVIARAILEYHRHTCLVFVPRTNEPDYIHIMKGKGCSSHVGRTGGGQPVTLGEGCVYTGIAVHELMHAVGFWHEQSRWDRGDHVNIYFQNIAPGMEFNFKRYNWAEVQNLSVAYDTSSVMHYGAYAFARDRRRPTIKPKKPNMRMGQRDGFSQSDILKINRLYNCDTVGVGQEGTTENPVTRKNVNNHMEGKACVDMNSHCAAWAELGECALRGDYLKSYCPRSCKQCEHIRRTTPPRA